MPDANQTQKAFLLIAIVLGVFIISGLIWAISSSLGPKVLDFNDDNDPTFGPGESTAVVRIFSDFQCPACRMAEDGLNYAIDTYGDEVRFVWNDYPIQAIHRNALSAANAARCAEEQGKFWEYRTRLFDDQDTWKNLPEPNDKFLSYADALGLNGDDFAACTTEESYQNKIMDDLREGQRVGIGATPSFFFNNKILTGALDNDVWDREIQTLLTVD
ncbi:MAG: thioredoxin domain-containing protein [Patescibacteria group bacterium]|nr:DsbA family protein [Patescibacteria group bacterium]MBU2509316.1 DsbA family protein [Patescibacteria group bacterium]